MRYVRFTLLLGLLVAGCATLVSAMPSLRNTQHVQSPFHQGIFQARMERVVLGTAKPVKQGGLKTVAGWQTIMSEGFEGNWPDPGWRVSSESGANPSFWGCTTYFSHSGIWALWCARSGPSGCSPAYDYNDNMDTWVVYGPFSLQNATQAQLTFYADSVTEPGCDYCFYGASTDGAHYHGYNMPSNTYGWGQFTFDISALCGQSQVWIAFNFSSDSSNIDPGTFLDDIVLQQYVPVQSYLVTPQASSNGTISPGSAQSVTAGGSVTFTAMPYTGYTVGTWTLDGAIVQTGGISFTLSNVTANHTVGVSFVPSFPADTNQDSQLGIDEVTAYATAWKTGVSWTTMPYDIPISYVTYAGCLWRSGGGYQYDGTNPSPLCWVMSSRTAKQLTLPRFPTAKMVRTLSATRSNGAPVSITLQVTPAAGGSCYAVEDSVAAGWTISGISAGGKARAGKVTWGPFFDTQARNFTYVLTPTKGTHGACTLKGTASFDGRDLAMPTGTITAVSVIR